ncbi:MAG: hypothetical protein WC455_04120 [Dehalococcoidia bacterium]|jgi:hypothetical protein
MPPEKDGVRPDKEMKQQYRHRLDSIIYHAEQMNNALYNFEKGNNKPS